MYDPEQNTNHIEVYLITIFASVSRLVAAFYENTLDFNETLHYVYVINTINTEVAKILKNNAKASEYCHCMNIDLRRLEGGFNEPAQFRQIIRSIILHNDLFINKIKKSPEIES